MDKQVNVKITANTSKFKKAISDATKSLDKFKKSGDKVSKTNIDKNLNKQFKNVSKESKKTDKQLKQNEKTLKKLNKTKLNNINKQFSNMNKTVKNNQKTLQSLQKTLNSLKSKSIEAVNKALTSMSKGASTVSKGFTNVKNVINNISNKAIEAVGKSLANIKEKCTPVANGFKTIKDKISSISGKAIDTVKSSLDKIKDKCSPVANGFTNIKNKINDIKTGAFSTLSSKLDGIKTKVSDAGNKFKDLKSRISDAAKESLQKLTDSTTKLNEEGTKSGNIFTNFGNKIKSLTSSAIGGLSSKIGLVVSSTGRMGSTFATTAAQVALVTTATKTLTGSTNNLNGSEKTLTNSTKSLTREEVKWLATKTAAEIPVKNTLKLYRESEEKIKRLTGAEKTDSDAVKKNTEEIKKASQERDRYKQRLTEAAERLNRQKEALNNESKQEEKATKTTKENTKATKENAKANDDDTKKVKTLGEAFKGLKSSLGNILNGDFSGGFKELKNSLVDLFKAMPGWVKVVVLLGVALKKLYDLGKNRFFEGLSTIKNDFQPITDFIKNIGSQIKTTFETITDFRLNLSGLVEAGVNFESQMNKVGNISGANSNQLEKLSDKAKLLGSTTRFQAYQIGQAYEYMGMAGWSAAEMLEGVNSVINLSILSGTNLATASDIVTDDLTAMGLQANQASDFVDKLAATITRSNTTVELYGESMKQCGAQAGTLGISVTDLNTSIGLMANAGIKGSKAGMSMKNMLANMAAPTEKMEKALKQLGLTADETGSYLKTTADGNVDLEATCKSLMKAMKGMGKTQQMSLITAIAGKNAAPGIIAMLSQGESAWNSLSNQIENSTSKVQYWNENMHIMKKSGDDAREVIKNFKDVFEKTEEEATAMGMSTEDLAFSIQILGADGKVTAGNMRDLMKVFESMNSTSGKTQKKWRKLSDRIKDSDNKIVKAVRTGFDYDATVAKIRADTSGLTQAQKEQLIAQLKTNMSYDEANKICGEYKLTAKHVTLASMDYTDKLEYLRESLKGCTDEQIRAALKALRLSDAYDEVREVVKMSDKDWKQYKKNQETIKSLSEQMAKAMDEDTKGALLGLASAIEGKAIQVFERLKDKIKGASNALATFFAAWKEKDFKTALLGGYKDDDGNVDIGLVKKVQTEAKKIPKVIQDAIAGAKNFVTGGSLQGILDIGTAIVQNVCKGISSSKENIRITVSGLIDKIGHWIIKNGPAIKKALTDVFSAIKDAVDENRDTIRAAADTLMDIVYTYLEGKDSVMYDLGGMLATKFIEGGLRAIARYPIKWGDAVKGVVGDLNSSNHSAYSDQVVTNEQFYGKDSKKQRKNNSNVVYAAEIEKAKKAGNKTVDVYKETVAKRLKDKLITENDAKEIEKALDRGEQAKKGAWKTTKAYISELQSQLASGDIDTNVFDAKLEKLSMVDKAKSAADKTSKAYYDSLEAGIMSGDVDLSAVDSILTSLDASDAIYKTASDTGKTYLDALKQQLISGQITPEEFNALVFSGNFEEAAKKYTETGKIEAGDVIDAKSFSNVQEVNDLMDALDDLNEKYSKLSGTITDSCKKMADSTRSNFVGIANIIRNQMVNVANIVRNQMLNCTNITRNQFVNMSNIIKNQSSNARQIVTEKFISIKKVITTQLSEARQIVTNKMLSISKVVNTQSSNARNNATRHFISLRKVIQTQMSEAYSSVSSYMNKIARSTNRTLSTKVNVTKSVKTVDAGKSSSLAALSASAFNSLNAMALSGSGLTYAAAGGSSGIGLSGANNSSANQSIYLELPTYIDGKVVAKTTARYMNDELAILDKKNSRKRGNK